MIIYKINQQNRYLDGSYEAPDDPERIYGIPFGTTLKQPPSLSENEYAIWNGSNWSVTTIPPPPLEIPEIPIKINAFYDRFGDIKYDILFTQDQDIQAYIQETRTLSYIDLNNPRVIEGLNVLLAKGFVFDPSVILNHNLTEDEKYII